MFTVALSRLWAWNLAAIVAVAAMVAVPVYQAAQIAHQVEQYVSNPIRGPTANRMAQAGVSLSSFVIGVAVAALIVAIIIPVAFSQFFSTVTTSWDDQTILIWGIIPVIVILAVVLAFLNKADDQA